MPALKFARDRIVIQIVSVFHLSSSSISDAKYTSHDRLVAINWILIRFLQGHRKLKLPPCGEFQSRMNLVMRPEVAGYIWTKLRMCWFTPSTKRLKWWLEFTLHTKAGSLGFCEGRHFNLFAAVRRKLPLPKMSPDPWCRVQSFPFPGLPKESQSSCEELLWSNHSEKGCGEYNSTTSADSSENTGSASKWTHRSHSVSSCGMGNYRWPLQSVQCTKIAALPLRTGKVCFSTVWCIVCWLER